MSEQQLPFNPESDPMETAAIERGSVRGAQVLFMRSLLVLGVTAFATVALARLLSPADYGAFAIAVAVQALGRQAVEFGLLITFVRRPDPPTLAEQKAITTFMLIAGSALALAGALVCLVVLPLTGAGGDVPVVIGIACLALPFFAVRAVPMILLERGLNFGRIAAIEVAETFAFYLFAVPAAVAGLGAVSLAGAVPVSAIIGAAAATIVRPWHWGLSRDLSTLRPTMRFSATAAALPTTYFLREFGVVTALALVGGQALAGFYAMSQRVFSVPTALMHAVWRVGIAGLARSRAGAERARQGLRAAGVTAVAIGLPIAAVTGATEPLISVLFGDKWLPAGDVVLFAAPGVMLLGSVGASLSSLALADGDAKAPLVAEFTGAVAAVGLAALLGAALGEAGAGLAAGCGLTLIVAILIVRSSVKTPPAAGLALRAVAAAAIGTAVGRATADVGDGALALFAALVSSSVAWLGASLLMTRSELLTLRRLLARHAPGIRGRDTSAASDSPSSSGTTPPS